jgi:SAM-dependent methyltransferase
MISSHRDSFMTRGPGSEGVFPRLVCPIDQRPLEDDGDSMACPKGHRFRTHLGIPHVVISESGYADAFGEQWNRYRATQLDSYTHAAFSMDRLKRCLGDALWARLNGSTPIGVLETGCGAGRFTEVLLRAPAAVVTSTDLSSAVEANQANCPASDRHRIIRCDLNHLPFPAASYDLVICLGVIQHTPDPDAAIANLYSQVRPGGWLVVDCYAPTLSHYTKITALVLRPVLKRLPPRLGLAATEWLTKVFFPLHRAVRHHPRLQMLLSRVSPLLTYYHAYPQLDDRLQYEWALLDTHDNLTDYYKHFRTVPQILRILTRLGAGDVLAASGGNGIEARCRKPA